ncbi:MAG TPA: hypothetical protein VGV18_09025, partial [Verrucomicrobiae bacterium]|nr:hypothetical protein [Verrucomicrobiae bacterium]
MKVQTNFGGVPFVAKSCTALLLKTRRHPAGGSSGSLAGLDFSCHRQSVGFCIPQLQLAWMSVAVFIS